MFQQPSEMFESLASMFYVPETKPKHERHNIRPMQFHGRVPNVEKHAPVKPMAYAKYGHHEKVHNAHPLTKNVKTPRERRYEDIKPSNIMAHAAQGKKLGVPDAAYRYANVTYQDLVDKAAFSEPYDLMTYDPEEELLPGKLFMTSDGKIRPEFLEAFELEEDKESADMIKRIISQRTPKTQKFTKNLKKRQAKGIPVEPVILAKEKKADALAAKNLEMLGGLAADLRRKKTGETEDYSPAALESKIEKYTNKLNELQRELIDAAPEARRELDEQLQKLIKKRDGMQEKLTSLIAAAAKKAVEDARRAAAAAEMTEREKAAKKAAGGDEEDAAPATPSRSGRGERTPRTPGTPVTPKSGLTPIIGVEDSLYPPSEKTLKSSNGPQFFETYMLELKRENTKAIKPIYKHFLRVNPGNTGKDKMLDAIEKRMKEIMAGGKAAEGKAAAAGGGGKSSPRSEVEL